jgi:hypothetical protein
LLGLADHSRRPGLNEEQEDRLRKELEGILALPHAQACEKVDKLAACRTRDFQPLDFAAGACPAVDGCKNALDWASTVTACMFSRLGMG